jgi:hypothetical protein
VSDINVDFAASQPGDACGMCDCVLAGLADRDLEEHGACYCGGFAYRRVTLQHGESTHRLAVCGRCIQLLMNALTQAVAPDPATADIEAQFESIISTLETDDFGAW